MTPTRHLVTMQDVAARLGCTDRQALWTMRRAGLLIDIGTPRRPVYRSDPDEVTIWLASRAKQTRRTADAVPVRRRK